MNVSRFSEPCDTIDGAGRQQRRSIRPVIEIGRSDRRWEDDGGPAAGAVRRIVAADVDVTKLTWSKQSLRELPCAIRASRPPATDAAAQEDVETDKARALQAAADRRAGSESDQTRSLPRFMGAMLSPPLACERVELLQIMSWARLAWARVSGHRRY